MGFGNGIEYPYSLLQATFKDQITFEKALQHFEL